MAQAFQGGSTRSLSSVTLDESCRKIDESEAISILNAMRERELSEEAQIKGCQEIAEITTNAENREIIIREGAVFVISSAIRRFSSSASLVRAGCCAIK